MEVLIGKVSLEKLSVQPFFLCQANHGLKFKMLLLQLSPLIYPLRALQIDFSHLFCNLGKYKVKTLIYCL